MALDVIILDELGYTPCHQSASELLFQFISSHYERGSLIITSNRKLGEWIKVFHDEKMPAALLVRVTHKAHIVPISGSSYRLKESYSK